MRKLLLLCLCTLFFPIALMAQRAVQIISSDRSESKDELGVERIYRPVFLHEGSTLSADSADYNSNDRFFDAFGNVVITQPDGTVVYSDKLHYIKDTRIAILTNNVRMVDSKSVLTTNHLTYNMASKIGTYVQGGRIISGTDTLTSKNGYYFENTKDSYFRYDVIVRTPDTRIYTDTLRYNSERKIAYFYGPTNIEGQSGNLYTENGDYHTESDIARFGKNNLYTEGSKFLRGDSLYYDGNSGYGRAVKNVVFIDTTEQIIMYSQLGVYRKKDESTTMTEKAYMVFLTQNDSTATDSAATDSLQGIPKPEGEESALAGDSTLLANDSTLTNDSSRLAADSIPPPTADSVFMAADTLFSKVILLKDYHPMTLNLMRDGGDLDEDEEAESSYDADQPDDLTSDGFDVLTPPDNNEPPDIDSLGRDSLGVDSLRKQLRIEDEAPPDIAADSLMKTQEVSVAKKPSAPVNVSQQFISDAVKRNRKHTADPILNSARASVGRDLAADSTLRSQSVIPKGGEGDSTLMAAQLKAMTPVPDSLKAISDTARTRVVLAYHNMKIYKSDLQAVADSAYYGYADSIIRCYGSPMIWSQGSQLSSDTLYMQLKNQRLDNMLLTSNAFIVSTQGDSTKFNQVKGRKITGFFTNNKLDRMFVDGNAESIYYTMDGEAISGMTKSIGSRIKIVFQENEVTDIINIRKTETSYSPIAAIDRDKEILPGFIWRPKDRPMSKEDVINRAPRESESQRQETEVPENADEENEERESPSQEEETSSEEGTETSVKEGEETPTEEEEVPSEKEELPPVRKEEISEGETKKETKPEEKNEEKKETPPEKEAPPESVKEP